MSGDFTASYISLMGLGEMLGEDLVEIIEAHPGDYKANGYVGAGSAKDSDVIKKLNPPQRFPAVDMNVRAFGATVHPTEVGGQGFTADEFYRLILSIDMGGQYFSRENKNEATQP